ncbi:hypothetical protein C9400_19705, partial [Xanthomonas vasicola pv. vasculorum]
IGSSTTSPLAHAIAGRIFLLDNLSDQELQQRARVILDNIINKESLNADSDHDVPVDSIKQLFA